MRYHTSKTAIVLSIGAGLSPVPLAGQEVRESIYAQCAQIPDDRERLACFDQTYARENDLIEERDEARRLSELERFGLTPKQVRERESDQSETSATATINGGQNDALSTGPTAQASSQGADIEIAAVVSEVLTDELGNFVLFLDNGQIWRTTSNKSLRGRVKTGWKAKIVKIWSGGYRMTFAEKSGFLGVKRVR